MQDESDDRRIALVAGGTAGIGRSIVQQLLADGYRVSAFGRTATHLDETRQAIGDTATFHGGTVDLRDHGQLTRFLATVEEEMGTVSCLIYASGISPKREGQRVPLHEIAPDEWDDVFTVNLTGAFRCCQAVLPAMMERGFGRIVMIGSSAARFRPRFAGASYVASKAGLAGLVRSVAAEYASYGITANTVAPGNIATAMTGGAGSPQNLEAAKAIPAGYVGDPRDVAGIVRFLCSAEARFINGATVDVTGAEHVAP